MVCGTFSSVSWLAFIVYSSFLICILSLNLNMFFWFVDLQGFPSMANLVMEQTMRYVEKMSYL